MAARIIRAAFRVDNQQCGDGGSTAVDAVVPSTVYIGCATGYPVNASYQNGTVGTFSPAVNGIDPTDPSDFIPPLATDPNTANLLYFGTTRIYQSFDAANTWTALTGPLVSAPGDWLTAIAVEPGIPTSFTPGQAEGKSLPRKPLPRSLPSSKLEASPSRRAR